MCISRTLLLAVLGINAIMVIVASSASAVEVVTESTGVHCSAISESIITPPSPNEVTGGCPLVGQSTGHLELGGPFGIMINCPVFMEGKVNESGHAIASIFKVGGLSRDQPEGVGTTCEANWLAPCDPPLRAHPELQVGAELSPFNSTQWAAEGDFCVESYLGNDIACHVAGRVVEIAPHTYHLTFASHSTTPCENQAGYSLQGELKLVSDAAHPKIELK